MKRCRSCLGIYDPNQDGGYYHACPPDTINPRDENVKSKENGEIKKIGKGSEEVE